MTDAELQQKRLIAAAIDIGIGFALGIVVGIGIFVFNIVVVMAAGHDSVLGYWVPRILGFASTLISLAYMLGRDMLGGGRSLGKKTQDLTVVTAGGSPIGVVESVKRNAIFALGALLAMLSATLHLIPCVGGVLACLLTPLMLLGGLISILAAVVEIVKITQDPDGIRLGDQIAGTRVVRG